MTDLATLRRLMDGWQPPPELARVRPRRARLTAGGAIVLFLAAVFAAAAAAGLVASQVLARLEPLLVLPLAAVALLLVLLLRWERRLLEDGRPAPGVITRLGTPGEHGRYVYYEFPQLSGARAAGRFGPVHGKRVPAIGSTIVVLYDPDNPNHNARYPLSLVKLRRN
jgi:hypothetical protein